MANPQRENGHVQIATEIFDALCRFRVSGEARQVLDFIIRKTYGFNKKEDAIALSQFCAGTGLRKQTICKAILHLSTLNLITKKGNDIANVYRFNKDFDTWKSLPKKVTLPKKVISVTNIGKKRNPKRDIQKTVTIDTITKDITPVPDGTVQDEVNLIIGIFHDNINPQVQYANAGNRSAVQELIAEYGYDKTAKYAKYACAVQGKPYTPRITTPYQLKIKLADLRIYAEQEKEKKGKHPDKKGQIFEAAPVQRLFKDGKFIEN